MSSILLLVAGGLACGALLLAGCGSGSSKETSATPEPTASPTQEVARDLPTCIQGDWLADNEQLRTVMNELNTEEEFKSVTGTMTMSFGANEDVVTTYDEWAHEITEAGTDVIVTRNGITESIYRVISPTEIETADTGGAMTITTRNVASGETRTVEPVPGSPNDMSVVQVACDTKTLVLTIEGRDLLFSRK